MKIIGERVEYCEILKKNVRLLKVATEIEPYDSEKGISIRQEEGAEIRCLAWKKDAQAQIEGNPAGLEFLAKCFLTLAQDSVPQHTRIFMSKNDMLSHDSVELVIEKV